MKYSEILFGALTRHFLDMGKVTGRMTLRTNRNNDNNYMFPSHTLDVYLNHLLKTITFLHWKI